MSLLELENIHHTHGGEPILRGVDLTIEANEIVCLLGPSGCGKTTLLRLAAGLEVLQRGTIRIAGDQVAGPGQHRAPEQRGVGFVFQDYALFPHLDVAANVAFGLRGLPAAERSKRVEELLRLVGLDAFGARYPDSLSGGEQQRVALARALAPRPRLVLLDEPFSGLDASGRHQVREETRRVLAKEGIAALLVTHDGEEAMELADRIALMRAGEIVQCGRSEELFFQPTDAYVASFLGTVNRLPGRIIQGRFDSPFGPVSAADLEDGTEALLVIREEGLELAPEANGAPARGEVESTRLLGGQRLTVIRLAGDVNGLPLRIRHDAGQELEPGTTVGLRLRPGLAHVFGL